VAINKRVLKDGTIKFVLDWWHSGKRSRKFFVTKTEAKNYRTNEVEKKKLDGEYVAPNKIALFKDAAVAWLQSRANRRASTYGLYAIEVNKHLLPKFGEMKLSAITVEAVEKYRDEITKRMAPSTAAAIMRVLSAIFDKAMHDGRAAGNPCRKLERAYRGDDEDGGEDKAVKETDILNPGEIRKLLDDATPGLWRTLFQTAAATGARSGELFALKWGRVIFGDKPRIEIRESLSRSKGPNDAKAVARFTKPKSKKGSRDIPLDKSTMLALKEWKLRVGSNRDEDLVFPHPTGAPLERSTLFRAAFLPALKRAGLRRVKFHSLRHSFASGLIANGARVTEVQYLLGHSKASMTLDIYSHWFREKSSDAGAAYAEELFGPDRHLTVGE
jgi:integrase